MHLMSTRRTHIVYDVGDVSRFMENTQQEHWTAVNRIILYLHEIAGICCQANNKVDFCGYLDTDWAGDHPDRNLTSSGVFMVSEHLSVGKQEAVKCVAV